MVILVTENSIGPSGGFEEGGVTGRQVEVDFAQRETEFEQKKGLIPRVLREEFNKEWIGTRAEFSGNNRLLLRNWRLLINPWREFATEVVYDFQAKTFSLVSPQEHVRIRAADFGAQRDIDLSLPRPAPAVAIGVSRRFLQANVLGVRSFFDIELFLSSLSDPVALRKLGAVGKIETLRMAREVTIVQEDAIHHMYEVRPVGKVETFYVLADFVGSARPLGKESEVSQMRQRADDSSRRIVEFMDALEKTGGLNALAYTIQVNLEEVTVALGDLKSLGIPFSDDLQKVEAAYKIIKNAYYQSDLEVDKARLQVNTGRVNLNRGLSKVYEEGWVGSQSEVPRAERVVSKGTSASSGMQSFNDDSFANKVLRSFSTRDGLSLIGYTADKNVNYFGRTGASNAFIEQDVNGRGDGRYGGEGVELAHSFLFDKPVLNTRTFTHETSKEYSRRWVGPMLYDSLDVQTSEGWIRFTVGYTVDGDKNAIYALVVKAL